MFPFTECYPKEADHHSVIPSFFHCVYDPSSQPIGYRGVVHAGQETNNLFALLTNIFSTSSQIHEGIWSTVVGSKIETWYWYEHSIQILIKILSQGWSNFLFSYVIQSDIDSYRAKNKVKEAELDKLILITITYWW